MFPFASVHPSPRLTLTASALSAMTSFSAAAPDTETGGLLLGRRSGGRILVCVATGPGEGSERGRSYFRTDGEEAARQYRHFRDCYGFDYLGEWHKHPQGCAEPSFTDRRQVAEILEENPELPGFLCVILSADPEFPELPPSLFPYWFARGEKFSGPLPAGICPWEAPLAPGPELERVVIERECLVPVLDGSQGELVLRGKLSGESKVVHVARNIAGDVPVRVVRGGETHRLKGEQVLIRVENGVFSAHQIAFSGLREVPLRVYSPGKDVFSRNGGWSATKILPGKRVAFVGLGSVGSVAALELARAGVGAFLLIDPDRLEPENVCRHSCHLDDLGRYKTAAVADRLRAVNPACRVDEIRVAVEGAPEGWAELFSGCDLVIVSTDTDRGRALANQAAISANRPALFISLLERAEHGYCQLVVPGKTACRHCIIGEREEVPKGEFAYASLDVREQSIQPGLSADIATVTMQGVRMALDHLSGNGADLPPVAHVFNRPVGGFDPGLYVWPPHPAIPSCPVCGGEPIPVIDMKILAEIPAMPVLEDDQVEDVFLVGDGDSTEDGQ